MSEENAALPPSWRVLSNIQRRVIGVLVEKAKTTPDAYPLSLNGLTTGCNQKSNRDPQMNLESWEVEQALDELREMGAVSEVHGDGRVVKFRHYMKDWLGCDGSELAIMAELLLRGPQTVGDLRARASRMAKIASQTDLQPLLDSLESKRLVIPLTPRGRGQMVTHALFSEKELAEQRNEFADGRSHAPEPPSRPPLAPRDTTPSAPAADLLTNRDELQQLRQDVEDLKTEVARLKKEIEDIWASVR